MCACAHTDMHTRKHKCFSSLSQMHPPHAYNTVVVNFSQRNPQEHKKSMRNACRRADLTVLIWLFACLPVDSILQQVIILDRDPGACVLPQPTTNTTMAAALLAWLCYSKNHCRTIAHVWRKVIQSSINLLNIYIYTSLLSCVQRQYRRERERCLFMFL